MTNHKLIEAVTKSQLRTDLPSFRPGDTLRVHVRIIEGTRERIQVFEGVVIKRRGGGVSETFTVRKISSGVGVERTFPHNHETLIQAIVNAILLLPLYNAALLPITPIVSKIACGLSNETDKAKLTCFIGDII